MTAATTGSRTVLYDGAALERVLDVMGARLAGLLAQASSVTLVGVRRRGAPLADALRVRLMAHRPGLTVERLDLLIKRYADDLSLLHPETALTEQPGQLGLDLRGQTLVVVDDVLYRGFSLNKAVQYLVGKGGETILTAVLADRVCATLPVHADVAGLRLQVSPDSIVECHVPPFEPVLQLVLLRAS